MNSSQHEILIQVNLNDYKFHSLNYEVVLGKPLFKTWGQ